MRKAGTAALGLYAKMNACRLVDLFAKIAQNGLVIPQLPLPTPIKIQERVFWRLQDGFSHLQRTLAQRQVFLGGYVLRERHIALFRSNSYAHSFKYDLIITTTACLLLFLLPPTLLSQDEVLRISFRSLDSREPPRSATR
jgi:hypothetical protein